MSPIHYEIIRPHPGGQYVGTSQTVKATHIETGVTVTVGFYPSVHKNKQAATEMIEWFLANLN